MISRKREHAVKNLVSLYTVVIGVALSLAVVNLVDRERGLETVTLSSALLFVAFVATLLPFFHGALRHLDDAYIENPNPEIKDHALILDFLLLFFHAVAFVFLSLLLRKPAEFAYVLTGVLVIDVIWGVLTHFLSPKDQKSGAEGKWAFINFSFVAIAVVLMVEFDVRLPSGIDDIKLSVPIVFLCVIRTMLDYGWCREFYFPR